MDSTSHTGQNSTTRREFLKTSSKAVAGAALTASIARPGYTMLKCDYAGQELRIVTNLSNEGVWIKEFLEGDGDLHTITAMAFYNKAKGEVTKD